MNFFNQTPLPPDPNPRPKKKRRPALSCVTCRDRKLKCDKERPRCGRCVQTGPDQPCVYVEAPARHSLPAYQHQVDAQPPNYNHPTPRSFRQFDQSRSPVDATNTVRDATPQPETPNLESRLARLEKILVQAVNQTTMALPTASPIDHGSPISRLPPVNANEQEESLIYPGSYRGYGLTHPAMLVCKFNELPSFLVHMRSEYAERTLQLKSRIETWRAANMDSRDFWNDNCGFTSAIATLPSRATLDRLVFAYFDSFEPEYPILDKSKFMSAYALAWDRFRFSPSPHLLMTLLLILATTVNLPDSKLADLSPTIEPIKPHLRRYIHLSERWLLSRGTQVPDLESVRLYCLLILAKRYNGFGRNQVWITAGSMARVAMLVGLHAQAWRPGPGQEAHRSLWITVLELDLLTSVDAGMVPSVPVADFTRISEAEKQHLLHTSGDGSATPHQVDMALSLGLRAEICCMLNSNVPEVTGQRTADQEKKFREHLLPLTAPSHNAPGIQSSPDRQPHLTELKRAKLQKYLLMIYLPYALQGPLQQQFPHYKRACVDVAINILSDHQAFLDKDDFAVCFKIDDAFQAGLIVCNEIYQPIQPGIPALTQPTGYVTLIKPIIRSALNVLTQQILHVGHWHSEYFLLCLAMGLVKSKTWPNKISQYVKEVVDLLDESCTFITTPKTPSMPSPTQNQSGHSSLVTPAQPTPHTHNLQQSPLDASNDKDLFAGLDTVSESFQDIIEFLGLSYPLDSLDPYMDNTGIP